jgi:4-amino-4-deoxy-L-arabinose transferase-like glycosyltransferase
MRSNRWPFIAFLGGSLFILFFNLWGRSLENHDYLRYAEVAKEMIKSGDWIVPRFNGEIYLHKPPLLFWLIALPSKIYGSVTPFLARLPSAFFAWVGGLIVYLWGRKMWGGERYGLVSSGMLISSYLYFWQGRIARTDMVFSVLILLSLYFFYLSYFERKLQNPSPPPFQKGRSQIVFYLSFVFMGMAGLTKGAVGVVFPFLIISLFLLWEHKWKRLFQKEFILGYLIIFLIWSAWIIPFIQQVGWGTALQTWTETKILTRHEPIYLYFYRIWIDFAPWSIFFPLLFTYLWKKNKSKDEKFLILWFLTLFILLTLFSYRASKYLLPAFPALALLMGGFWRKRSLVPFLIIFLGTVLVWHGYEYSLVRKNHIRTPGLTLHQVLNPYREKEILGYQMDIDILGKINFYGDRLVPQIRRVEDLKKRVRQRKDVLILTTDRSLQDLMGESFYLNVVKEIDIKGGILILASLNTI